MLSAGPPRSQRRPRGHRDPGLQRQPPGSAPGEPGGGGARRLEPPSSSSLNLCLLFLVCCGLRQKITTLTVTVKTPGVRPPDPAWPRPLACRSPGVKPCLGGSLKAFQDLRGLPTAEKWEGLTCALARNANCGGMRPRCATLVPPACFQQTPLLPWRYTVSLLAPQL